MKIHPGTLVIPLLLLATAAKADPDTTPPRMTEVVARSDWVVEAFFSEQLSAGPAEQRTNFSVYAGDYSSIEVELAEYLPSSRSVALSLKYPLQQKEEYRLTARSMTDLYGNVNPSDHAYFLPIDRTPPWPRSAVTLDATHVSVLFDEAVDRATACDPGNYSVFETLRPDLSLPVTAAVLLTPDKVWLTLEGTMVQPTSYSLRVTGVRDLSGIAIGPPGMTTVIRFPDDRPPYVDAVRQQLCSVPVRLEILFNEPVDSCEAFDTDNYLLHRKGDAGRTVPLSRWARYGRSRDKVLLGLASPLEPGASYTLNVSSIRDLTGNPVAEGSSFDFTTQSPPPPIYQCSYDAVSGCLSIGWTLAEMSLAPPFEVRRAHAGSGDPAPVPGGALSVNGLKYTFVDGSVIRGKSYVYTVEYVIEDTTAVLLRTGETEIPPPTLLLFQNFPNPFNPSTIFSWSQPRPGKVSIEVFDVSGRWVALACEGWYEAGSHVLEWTARAPGGESLRSGVYIFRLSLGGSRAARKMVILR